MKYVFLSSQETQKFQKDEEKCRQKDSRNLKKSISDIQLNSEYQGQSVSRKGGSSTIHTTTKNLFS